MFMQAGTKKILKSYLFFQLVRCRLESKSQIFFSRTEKRSGKKKDYLSLSLHLQMKMLRSPLLKEAVPLQHKKGGKMQNWQMTPQFIQDCRNHFKVLSSCHLSCFFSFHHIHWATTLCFWMYPFNCWSCFSSLVPWSKLHLPLITIFSFCLILDLISWLAKMAFC